MAQTDPTIENQTMPNARTDINNSFQSFLTQHRGTGRPSYAVASTIWVDSDTPGSNVVTLNYFDGTDDIALGTIDESGNTFTATNHVKSNVTPSFTVAINEAAAVDVASATTTDIGAAASNNVRITGTTTITGLGTAAAGITRDVRFAGALTLTHNATSLILPTAANITTAADDTAEFLSLGSGNWFCQRYNRKSGAALAGASKLVQRVIGSTAAVATGTTVMPIDDTIPQNTEGFEVLTQAITPTSATNILRFRIVVNVAHSTAAATMVAALFQDTTASAKAVAAQPAGTNFGVTQIVLIFEMVAGTTSSTTFKLRVGAGAVGTTTINGSAGARLFGGVFFTSITIEETEP